MTVYLFLGDDEEKKAIQIEKLRDGRQAETFDASEATPEAVVSACNSSSLFGDGTFVLLRNLDAWNAAQKAKVVAYIGNPSEDADLVLAGTKLGAREKLLAAAEKSGKFHKFEQPTGKALVKWATGRARKLGLELPEDVAEDLIERCSGDKIRLAREIEKLSLYVGGEERATKADVDLLCPPGTQSNIFAFVDSLAEGRRGKAVEMLEKLSSNGEAPMKIMVMVRRQFRLISRASALFERGVPRSEVAKDLKVAPFVVKKLEEQSRKLGERDLERALSLILELERGLKGGSDLPELLQVELAVVALSGRDRR
ncbi:MAG: DNA polymerase III subunit delta [Actinomycetota bacterium]|jgi:DNA polymerase-3 subunit delta|nr:DNA polymerase III subunit delta [Rubrobacter sp.]MDQ3508491.1 DNA polymerase III subunit delta [Actinomycetota bacterium]